MISKSKLNANVDQDLSEIEGFDALQSEYSAASIELPDSAIDRQVIAAAHRELANPKARTLPKNRWWRSVSLGFSAAAGFSFIVVAAQWFWPAPVRVLPGTGPAPVSFEVVTDGYEPIESEPLQPKKIPHFRPTLPEPQSNVDGEAAISDDLSVPLDSESNNVSGSTGEENLESQPLISIQNSEAIPQTAGKLKPDKEQWAREIVELFKSGDYAAGRRETAKFKQVYPAYPLDEQLKLLQR